MDALLDTVLNTAKNYCTSFPNVCLLISNAAANVTDRHVCTCSLLYEDKFLEINPQGQSIHLNM